jgi:hypothetical protein
MAPRLHFTNREMDIQKIMTFQINDFLSEISKGGYLRPHTFNVYIAIPSGLSDSVTGTTGQTPLNNFPRTLSLRAHQCATPSPTLDWVEISRYGVGPPQGYPHNAHFSNVPMSFICDKGGQTWNFFHQWLNKVFPFSPTYNSTGTTPYNSQPSYTAEYKENYASNIAIDIYDQIGNLAIEFILNFAYPLEIREVPLDWGEQGDLLELIVIFDYKDYSISGSSVGNLSLAQPILPATSSIPQRSII